MSTIEETETVEVKFIYDKLLLLSKDDWNRILDLANQTKLFESLELANIQSVKNAITKKEVPKEQALIKCYESLGKIKRFGITI